MADHETHARFDVTAPATSGVGPIPIGWPTDGAPVLDVGLDHRG